MFNKRKLASYSKTLHSCLLLEKRLAGAGIEAGLTLEGKKPIGAFAKIKTLNKTLREDLGERGELCFDFDLKGNLTLLLTFSWGMKDPEFEILKEIFYENAPDDDDEDEESRVFHDLVFCEFTEEDVTQVKYMLYGVKSGELAERTRRLLGYVFNLLDILYEDLEEEYGESDD